MYLVQMSSNVLYPTDIFITLVCNSNILGKKNKLLFLCIFVHSTLANDLGVKILSDLNIIRFDLWLFLKFFSSHLWFVLYSESGDIHNWLALLSSLFRIVKKGYFIRNKLKPKSKKSNCSHPSQNKTWYNHNTWMMSSFFSPPEEKLFQISQNKMI